MAEEPAPPPPRPADLGGTPPEPAANAREHAAADAGDPAEVSALLAASETRTTKFLAMRFAELGEALSGLAKAVEASGGAGPAGAAER